MKLELPRKTDIPVHSNSILIFYRLGGYTGSSASVPGAESLLSSLKRPFDSSARDDGGGEVDSESDDPKRLCIDEDGVSLQCTKCSYLAKWKSDLERHMKVSNLKVSETLEKFFKLDLSHFWLNLSTSFIETSY